MTQTEVLKLALEALEIMESRFGSEMFRHEIQPSTFGCHHNSETCPLCNGLVTGWKAVRAANQAITAIKEALRSSPTNGEAQPEQEPVAWLHWLHGPVRLFLHKDEAMLELERLNRDYPVDAEHRKMRPLVLGDTTPPQRKPLTDEQREEIAKGWRGRNWTVGDIIDAIEAAHGIKEEA